MGIPIFLLMRRERVINLPNHWLIRWAILIGGKVGHHMRKNRWNWTLLAKGMQDHTLGWEFPKHCGHNNCTETNFLKFSFSWACRRCGNLQPLDGNGLQPWRHWANVWIYVVPVPHHYIIVCEWCQALSSCSMFLTSQIWNKAELDISNIELDHIWHHPQMNDEVRWNLTALDTIKTELDY